MRSARVTNALLSSAILLACVGPALALDAEVDKPYSLEVVLQVSEHRMLTDVFKDRLKRELRDSLQAALGDLAKVRVVTQHPLLKEVEAKGLEAALDAASGPLGDAKVHFVRVGYADGKYRIFARQLDGLTGLASPVVRREETTDPQYVARTAALLVAKDFGPIGTVPSGDATEVRVGLKAGKLGAMRRWVQKGDLFAVVQVRADRGTVHAERVPWAYLRAESAPGVDGMITCRLLQRYKQSLGDGPGVLGYRCIKLGTGRALLRLRLVRESTRQPLPNQSVSIRRSGFDGPADEEFATDGDGAVVSAREYENIAFVQVQTGSSVLARVPIAIIDGRAAVVTVAPDPGAEARGQFELRRRQWLGGLYESLLVLDDRFKQLNQMVEAKEFDPALKSSQSWLKELTGDLERKEAEMKNLRLTGRELGQENPDLGEGDQRLQEMRARKEELLRFADGIKKIKEAGEQRKELLGMVERARLLEANDEFAKAMELYQKIAEQATNEAAIRQSAEMRRALIEKGWTTRDQADIQEFIFRQWPKLTRAAELKEQMERAQKMFRACRDAGDRLTPRMLLKSNLAHARQLEKRLKELQPKDREEDRREAEDIASVAGALQKLTDDLSAYLRGGDKK